MGFVIREEQLRRLDKVVQQIQTAAIWEYSSLEGPSALPEQAGVYVVFNKFTQEALYVGKTLNFRQALYRQQLMGTLGLKKYLLENPKEEAVSDMNRAKDYVRNCCSFFYLQESDVKIRGNLEGLVRFLTNCRYVNQEH